MNKKLICLAMLACLALAPGLIGHAESGIKLQYGRNTYTIEQASLPKSGFPFSVSEKDDTVILSDKDSGVTAEVDLAVMGKASVNALRSYYNDEAADTDTLFSKLIVLDESYIDAALESYKTNYLFGNGGEPGTEANMKLLAKATDKLFGQDSDIFVYNIIASSISGYTEQTHVDIFVPIRSSYAILNINFTMKSGILNKKNMGIINQMLGSIRIGELSTQAGSLQIFKNSTLVASINSGIYPNSLKPNSPVNYLEEPKQGFRLKYLASLTQYMQNNLTDDFYYNSFKISPNEFFSISVEPTSTPDTAASDKATAIKNTISSSGSTIKVTAEGFTTISGCCSVFLDYTLKENSTTSYIQDFLTVNNGHLYRLQLKSRSKHPSAFALNAFSMIFTSFEFIAPQPQAPVTASVCNSVFLDEGTGLSFMYPNDWKLTDTTVTAEVPITTTAAITTGSSIVSQASTVSSINFLNLKLNLPDISDFLDIYIVEDGLNDLPYKDLQSTLLLSSCKQDGKTSNIYKLFNYLDSGNRGRLCSSVTITNGERAYSMYIDINSNWVRGGKISDPEIAEIVNAIRSSFRLEKGAMSQPAAPAINIAAPKSDEGCGNNATPLKNTTQSGFVLSCS